MHIPTELRFRVDPVTSSSHADRRAAAVELRALGLSIREIAELAGAAMSTVSGWCSGVVLSPELARAVTRRTRRAGPRDTQHQRRAEINSIRKDVQLQVPALDKSMLWLGGTVLYWAEGAKTGNDLRLSNADAAALRLFIDWVREFHQDVPGIRAKINLHIDNDADKAMDHWAAQLGLTRADFTKAYIKPEGTGHRKNHLEWGVCQLRARKSTDAFHRTMAWIDGIAVKFPIPPKRYAFGGPLAQLARATDS